MVWLASFTIVFALDCIPVDSYGAGAKSLQDPLFLPSPWPCTCVSYNIKWTWVMETYRCGHGDPCVALVHAVLCRLWTTHVFRLAEFHEAFSMGRGGAPGAFTQAQDGLHLHQIQ